MGIPPTGVRMRLSPRLVPLCLALAVGAVACSAVTEPTTSRAPTLTPDAVRHTELPDTTCRSGYVVPMGRTC